MSDTVCASHYCSEQAKVLGMCPSCYAYWQAYRQPRPVRLVVWPGRGHPLATTDQVVKLTGLTYRVIDNAVRQGLVAPTVDAQGSGFSRGWAVDDVVALIENYARNKLPRTLSRINGISLKVDRYQLRLWVVSRWPIDAYEEWDGKLPEWLSP